MSINLRNKRIPLRASHTFRGSRVRRRASSPTYSVESVADIAQQPRLSVRPTILCKKYSGSESKTKVVAWLDLFELVTLGSSDKDQLIALVRHVSGEDIDWLARDILPKYQTITWTDVKKQIIQRFGRVFVNPFVEALKRLLSFKETVLTYYNGKKRLLDLADISETKQIVILTDDLFQSYYQRQYRNLTSKDLLDYLQSVILR